MNKKIIKMTGHETSEGVNGKAMHVALTGDSFALKGSTIITNDEAIKTGLPAQNLKGSNMNPNDRHNEVKDDYIRAKEPTIGWNDEHIEAKDHYNGAKDEHIEAKDLHIGPKDDPIETKDYHIESKDDHIEAKDVHIGPKVDHIETKDRYIPAKGDYIKTKASSFKSMFNSFRSMSDFFKCMFDSFRCLCESYDFSADYNGILIHSKESEEVRCRGDPVSVDRQQFAVAAVKITMTTINNSFKTLKN